MNVEVKFDDLNRTIISELEKAQKYVYIMVAWLSFDLYEDILISLLNKKVKVKVTCTSSNKRRKYQSSILRLENLGAKITFISMPNITNHMHHKIAIIDYETILTGSFNWTKNSEKNFENLMIVREDNKLAKEFLREYLKIIHLNNPNRIMELLSLKKCSTEHCKGKLINILVMDSEPTENTFEHWGDVISYCNICNTYTTIFDGYQDANLYFLIQSLLDVDTNEENEIFYLESLEEHFCETEIAGITIHAIGYVKYKVESPDGDGQYVTEILWKNKFVEIEDVYYETFGVDYC